jgi:histidine triad (HIT) family protein
MDEEDTSNMTPEQIAKQQKDNCIFCKIIAGEIPSKKVYEDTDFIGILDINPAADGHVLLLPKQHFQIMPQIPAEIVGNLGIACSEISSKIITAFNCEGTSIFIANGAIAGQRSPHFISHIIPRFDNDNILLNPKIAELNDDLFNSIRTKIMASLGVKPTHTTQGTVHNNQHTTREIQKEDLANKKQERKLDLDTNKSEEQDEFIDETNSEDEEYIEESYSEDEINSEEETNKKQKLKQKEDLDDESDEDANDDSNDQDESEKKHTTTKKEKKKKQTKSKINSIKPKTQTSQTAPKIDYDKLSRLLG